MRNERTIGLRLAGVRMSGLTQHSLRLSFWCCDMGPEIIIFDDVPPELAESVPGAPLETVLMSGVLEGRPPRPRDDRRSEI